VPVDLRFPLTMKSTEFCGKPVLPVPKHLPAVIGGCRRDVLKGVIQHSDQGSQYAVDVLGSMARRIALLRRHSPSVFCGRDIQ
jgi:hypothetical protein